MYTISQVVLNTSQPFIYCNAKSILYIISKISAVPSDMEIDCHNDWVFIPRETPGFIGNLYRKIIG